MKIKIFVLTILVLGVASAYASNPITAADTTKYLNTNQTVCGKVVGTNYMPDKEQQPTYLNLDKAYPDNIFTAVIYGNTRALFSVAPDVNFKDKNICVTGMLEDHKGKPRIVVSTVNQITLQQ